MPTRMEKEKFEYCTVLEKVHEPSLITFSNHDYIKSIMNCAEDRENRVSLVKIPEDIFKICTNNLQEMKAQTVIDSIKEQTFEKIPSISNAFTYYIENYEYPNHNQSSSSSSSSGVCEKLTMAKYFELVETQHQGVFIKKENGKEKIDDSKDTFSNYLNGKNSAQALYAPDIDVSFTESAWKENENFNLKKFGKGFVNQLRLITQKGKIETSNIVIPGIHTPYVYLGSAGSCFPVHLEDANLSSMNIQLAGYPKIWYFIKRQSVNNFETQVNSLLSQLPDTEPGCKFPLQHKGLIINEDFLIQQKIHYCKVIQKPGMAVITHPNGYHAGYNIGPNINEAINFMDPVHGVDYSLSNKHCGCKKGPLRLTFSESFIKRRRPNSLMNENRQVLQNPDDPEVIAEKEKNKIKRMNNAREIKIKQHSMNEKKKEFSNQFLKLYFSFLMAENIPCLKLSERQAEKFKKFLEASGISENLEVLRLGRKKIADLTADIVRQLTSIMYRPYFQSQEQHEIIKFINERRKQS